MSAAKDLANKKKKFSMGEYTPTAEEQEAYAWGVNNNLRISPRGILNKTLWKVQIFQKGRWVDNNETYGPVEVWEQMYAYYKHYYNEYRKKM